PERVPLEWVLWPALGDVRAGSDGRLPLAERDLGARIGAGSGRLPGGAVRVDVRSLREVLLADALPDPADCRCVLRGEPGLDRRACARATPGRQGERRACT